MTNENAAAVTSAATATAAAPETVAAVCCGTPEGAARAGACCDPVAKAGAVAAGADCCG